MSQVPYRLRYAARLNTQKIRAQLFKTSVVSYHFIKSSEVNFSNTGTLIFFVEKMREAFAASLILKKNLSVFVFKW